MISFLVLFSFLFLRASGILEQMAESKNRILQKWGTCAFCLSFWLSVVFTACKSFLAMTHYLVTFDLISVGLSIVCSTVISYTIIILVYDRF